MSHSVYILQSESTGRHYCGYSNDVERRLRQHNDPDYRGSKTTKRFVGPWKLVNVFECESEGEAVRLERKIKKRGIFRYLKDIQLVESRQRRD
ncbi:MAG: GIY-YIG nuclease family protein [Desulfobulbaceae bacterium]|nr:GIY-YIG nuclease family protein [Desulfobulbaceae bacterium]